MIGQCEALVSGSFALGFLDRVFWGGSDLGIYVELGEGNSRARRLGRYLIRGGGYQLLPGYFQGPDFELKLGRILDPPGGPDKEPRLVDRIFQEAYDSPEVGFSLSRL